MVPVKMPVAYFQYLITPRRVLGRRFDELNSQKCQLRGPLPPMPLHGTALGAAAHIDILACLKGMMKSEPLFVFLILVESSEIFQTGECTCAHRKDARVNASPSQCCCISFHVTLVTTTTLVM